MQDEINSLTSSVQLAERQFEKVSNEHVLCVDRQIALENSLGVARGEAAERTRENRQLADSYCRLEREYRLLEEEVRYLQTNRGMHETLLALESELQRYKLAAEQKEQENLRLIKKMHEFVKESDETQSDLNRRIRALESHPPPSDLRRSSKERRETPDRTSAPRRKSSKSIAEAPALCEKCASVKHSHHRSKSPITG